MLLPVGNRRLGTGVAAAVLVLALVGSSSAHSGRFARLVPLNPCMAWGPSAPGIHALRICMAGPERSHAAVRVERALSIRVWFGAARLQRPGAWRQVPSVPNLNHSTWGSRLSEANTQRGSQVYERFMQERQLRRDPRPDLSSWFADGQACLCPTSRRPCVVEKESTGSGSTVRAGI